MRIRFHFSAYRKWTRPETLSFLECYSQRRGQISESQDEATVFQYILDDMKDQGVWVTYKFVRTSIMEM